MAPAQRINKIPTGITATVALVEAPVHNFGAFDSLGSALSGFVQDESFVRQRPEPGSHFEDEGIVLLNEGVRKTDLSVADIGDHLGWGRRNQQDRRRPSRRREEHFYQREVASFSGPSIKSSMG